MMPGPSYKEELLARELGVSKEELPVKLRELKGDQGLRPLAAQLEEQTGIRVGAEWLSRYLNRHPQ